MKVYKFGGTSVGSAQRMSQVAQIINDADDKIIVLSAMSGTTNALVEISKLCYNHDMDQASSNVRELRDKYHQVVEELYLSEVAKTQARVFIDGRFDFLASCIKVPFSPQDERIILAQGELISTELFQYYLQEQGIRSALIPALSFMRVDRLGEPDLFYIKKNIELELDKHHHTPIFITQGYICLNVWGEVDNLQRGGSDYTATLIGAAINAQDVQIWTDIDGLHNNDPRIVENTSPVAHLSYTEAEELAYFGAKILHPLCVIPAHTAGVPIWLKNTMVPHSHGTYICKDPQGNGVKAIAAKDGITAIKIQSARMMMAYGFLRRIFEIFERYQTSIDMITTSEVAVSLTIEDDSKLSRILSEIREFGSVSVDKHQTIVSVVGHNIAEDAHSMDIFSALKGLPVRMISYGGSKNNISLLIESDLKKEVLSRLSKALF